MKAPPTASTHGSHPDERATAAAERRAARTQARTGRGYTRARAVLSAGLPDQNDDGAERTGNRTAGSDRQCRVVDQPANDGRLVIVRRAIEIRLLEGNRLASSFDKEPNDIHHPDDAVRSVVAGS